MKAFIIVTVATEIEGRYTAVKVEKAFAEATKVDAYFKNLAKNWREVIQMPNGNFECVCERNVIEIEIE